MFWERHYRCWYWTEKILLLYSHYSSMECCKLSKSLHMMSLQRIGCPFFLTSLVVIVLFFWVILTFVWFISLDYLCPLTYFNAPFPSFLTDLLDFWERCNHLLYAFPSFWVVSLEEQVNLKLMAFSFNLIKASNW